VKPRPTIKDVAALAQVSRQTVSRVINNKPEVSPATRARVSAIIEQLQYRPNAAARSMVSGRSCMLGCISPNFSDSTFANIIESALQEARRMGYYLLTGSAPTPDDARLLLDEMLLRQVDGLLVLNARTDYRYRHLTPLIEQGLALVYVGSTSGGEKVSYVRCDDLDGGRQATRHLIDLGHTAIATITGPRDEECVQDRLDGYLQAMAEAGLERDSLPAVTGDWSAESGYEATRKLLNVGRPITAIFAQNDLMAIGAIRALREAGYQVPADISVIGFDDIPLISFIDPPLTTIRQPMEELGRRAAQLLVQRIDSPDRPPEQALIRAQLIERASCAPLDRATIKEVHIE